MQRRWHEAPSMEMPLLLLLLVMMMVAAGRWSTAMMVWGCMVHVALLTCVLMPCSRAMSSSDAVLPGPNLAPTCLDTHC